MPNLSRRRQLEAMLAEEPRDPGLRYLLGMEFVGEGNDAEAARCFGEIMERTPDYPPVYPMGALALARLGRVDDAKAVLRRDIPAALRQGNHHAAGEMRELLETLDS